MTVKEIFALRKQGHIEEAYDEIRRQYAAHKGHYTTLCMFWTASDVLRLRVQAGRIAEAVGIFKALLRLLPNVDDADGRAHTSMTAHALRLAQAAEGFGILSLVAQGGTSVLHPTCWQTYTSPSGVLQSPVAQRFVKKGFEELAAAPTLDNALVAVKLLEQSVAHAPNAPENAHYKQLINDIIQKQS